MREKLSASGSYDWRHFLVSFGVKIFLTISIPVLIFLIALFCYNFSTTSNDMANRYIYAVENEIDGLLSSFSSIQATFTSDTDLKKYLLSNKHDLRAEEYATKFNNDTTNFCSANPAIQSIYLYRCSDNYIIAAGLQPPTSNYASNFSDQNFIDSGFNNQKYLDIRSIATENRTQTLLTCNFPVYYNALLAGFISINIDAAVLQEDILKLVPPNSKVYISHDELPFINFPIGITNISESIKTEYSANLFNGNISIGTTIREQNLTILLNYRQNDSTANIFINSSLFLLFVILLFIISVGVAYYLSSQNYKTMASIIVKSTAMLDWYSGKDSLDNDMVRISKKNKLVEQELYERISSFRDLQFKFLQTQISPHFLFNSLNVISMMDLEAFKKQTKIGKTVRLLSDILRYSITGSDFTAPFSDELDYSFKYLQMQNHRHSDKIHTVCNISPEVKDIKIIKFTLQPILENAIHYAICSEGFCHLTITAELIENLFVIDISNNGDVMSDDNLAHLNQSLNMGRLNPEHTSGLLNVNKRIKLIYGENYGCKMSQENNVTHLTITMPSE